VARAKLTTKNLAQRIDLEYFKHSHPFRRLRFILSVTLPALALLWLVGYALARNDRIYSGGRMSASHAVLTARCNAFRIRDGDSTSVMLIGVVRRAKRPSLRSRKPALSEAEGHPYNHARCMVQGTLTSCPEL